MSETAKPPQTADANDAERVQAEALDWLRRLTSGEVSRAELDALERWRAQSPAHRRALAQANLLWDVLGKVAHEADARRPAAGVRREIVWSRPVGRRIVLAGAAAASVAYLLARPPLRLWPALEELAAPYRTATGERRQLAVAPGVAVEMDTQTSLSAPVTAGDLTSLELISGQLAVSVEPDADKPVLITAAGGQVHADRASFDMRRDGGAVCVTCAEGVVRVSYRSDNVALGPGQQVSYGERGLGAAVATDPAVVTAWRRGLLIFRDVPLADVVAEVNRYRPGRIILINDSLAGRRIMAGFRLDQIDDVVNYIRDIFGAKIRFLPGRVVLLS